MLLSMALWKAVADRHDLLVATWDSGRVGQAELERLSTLVWGRLDATRQLPTAAATSGPGRARRLACPRPAGSPTRWPPHCGPGWASTSPRPTPPRGSATCGPRSSASATSSTASPPPPTRAPPPCSPSWTRGSPTSRPGSSAGASVGGLLGPLESEVARAERDLIVGASNRRADAHDEERARALRGELEARGAALRDLAARCVAAVTPAPRFAVPDVSALGPVPDGPRGGGRLPGPARRRRPCHDDGAGGLRHRADRARRAARPAGGVRREGRRPRCGRGAVGRPGGPPAPGRRGPGRGTRRPRPRPRPGRRPPGLPGGGAAGPGTARPARPPSDRPRHGGTS